MLRKDVNQSIDYSFYFCGLIFEENLSVISPPRTITTPTEQTEERSLLAVSKSMAAKSCISYVYLLVIFID